jgi:phospholipid:diacylglycerol acyltransferase
LVSGIRLADGDGTVPLLSLGGLCRGAWMKGRLNPAGSKVVTREYLDDLSIPQFRMFNPWHYLEAMKRLGR